MVLQKIASNRILNYHTCHPRHMVNNTVKSFISRALSHTSKKYHNEIKEKITEILVCNNFTRKYIEKQLTTARFATSKSISRSTDMDRAESQFEQFSSSILQNEVLSSTHIGQKIEYITTKSCDDQNKNMKNNIQNQKFVSMQYIPELTDSLPGRLKTFIPEVKVANVPPCLNRSLFINLKDKLPKAAQSNVVYKINCDGCEKCYIGETSQKLSQRMLQHNNDWKNRFHYEKPPTALAEHAKDSNHPFDFLNPKILYRSNNKRKLQINEANNILIHDDTTCHFKGDVNNISFVYYDLLKSTQRGKIRCQSQI